MLIIVRHGRTEANAKGLLLGRRLDPGLDGLGQRQAAALVPLVAGASRVVSSPLLRTRQTAERFGRAVEIDERWAELDYGDFDGRPFADIPASTWAQWRADPAWAPPNGESHLEVSERVRSACTDLTEEARDSDVVVVTHVSPIKAAVAWALGTTDEVVWRMFCAPASLTRIAVTGPTPSLHTFNSTAHLAAVSDP